MKFFDLNASPLRRLFKQAVADADSQAANSQIQPVLTESASDTFASISPESKLQSSVSPDMSSPAVDPRQGLDSFPPLRSSPTMPITRKNPTMQKLDQFGISAQSENNSSLKFSSNQVIPAVLKGNVNWQWLLKFSQQIHQAENLEQLFQVAVEEVRQELQADRVLIYRFQTENRGMVLAEALTNGYTPSLEAVLPAITFGAEQQQNYQQQIVTLNPAKAALSPYQSQLLGKYQIQSSLTVPIALDRIWGLLVVQHCSQPRQWLENEVTLLYQIATELRLVLQLHEFCSEREMLAQVSERVRSNANIEDICQTITDEARKQLNIERVCIYKFRPNFFGDFIYESGSGDFPRLVGSAWEDTYLQQHQGGRFRSNGTMTVEDVDKAGLTDCHRQTLKYFGIRSFSIVGIKQGEKLWGLLSGFQHSSARQWSEREVSLLADLARQLGTALQERAYLNQLEEEAAQRTKAAQVNQGMTEIIPKILQAQDLETLFRITNQGIRSLLKCDRVAIYRFQSDWQTERVAEAANKGVGSLEDAELVMLYPNTDLQSTAGDPYRNHTSLIVNNIYTSGFSAEEIEQLEDWQVKAYVMMPIFKQKQLWGLLGVYQNREPRSWAEVEITMLSQICRQVEAAMQRIDYVEQLAKTIERDRLVTKVVERIRQSLDLPQVFKTTARELRNALSADRVAIYQFQPGSNFNHGTIIAEDIKPGYISILSVEIDDNCFGERHAAAYKNGKITVMADISRAGVDNCYVEMLNQFQVQANLVLPLFRGGELWGLFCIHQCGSPRDWQEAEIEFARQIALQLNTAIQQGEYIEQLQQASQQLAEAAQREKAAKERLQQEVIQVLTAVRPALDGDLTVRAPITDDEVGTIADAYNNTLSSLRQIVTQMQEASRQVAYTSQTSEATINSLAVQAQQQGEALSQAQSRVKMMVNSIESVGVNAQQVEQAVQQTNQIVLTGDSAMNYTVEKILSIRETVAETDKRLQQLSESSRKISRVVSLISNFTTQTHLLALNASIEAARAGDYGRGFTIVADEVRSLARQSANAAIEIEQLVQEIQMGTAEVSTILETGIQQVEEGTGLVAEARDNLNAVVDATGQISHLVTEIAQATQEQTQQFHLVSQTMTEVADTANKTTEDSMMLSLHFKDLLTMAQLLQTKSDQFRVE